MRSRCRDESIGSEESLEELAILRSEVARLKKSAVVESSNDAIIGKSLEGVITSWNKGAQRIYGYAAEEVIGRSISFLVPSDRTDEISGFTERIQIGKPVVRHETVRVRKDGRQIHV